MQLIHDLEKFLAESLTPYHAQALIQQTLTENGFTALSELDEEWQLCEGGKYFVERNGATIAFAVGNPDNFSYKITASHLDSPALKLKERPFMEKPGAYALNVEAYGGGVWYTFFDRPLKIAGRVVKNQGGRVFMQTVQSPFCVSIPSQAAHINPGVNDNFSVNVQTDLCPVVSLTGGETEFWQAIAGDERVISYDLYAVNASLPYSFGVNDEFLAAPRIDDLASVYASLEALLAHADSNGVCVAAFFNNEEIGSATASGAGGDFLERTLRKIAFAFRFDNQEYEKAIASSFVLSVDNAHAIHPAHPEKSDPTNKVKMGGGIVIKSHANGAYITDALSSGVFKTMLEKAGVPYQTFFNRSDMRSGRTLGAFVVTKLGMHGVDIGLPQLAMHSSCESMCKQDYIELVNGLTAFYSTNLLYEGNAFLID